MSECADDKETRTSKPSSARIEAKPPLTPQQDERWAIVSHLGGIVGFLPALLIYVFLAERGDKTADASIEALNFQATISVPIIVVYILSAFVTGIPDIGWAAGNVFWFLAGLLFCVGAVVSVIGAVQQWRYGSYRYPFAVRLIRR